LDVKILYDNEAKYSFKGAWGFSCLIGGELLFDTGGDVNTLLFNMHRFNVNRSNIKLVFLSHEHRDHVGGIQVLRILGKVKVFIPKSFSRNFKRVLTSHSNVTLIEVDEAVAISNNIFTTGELGSFIKEQSVFITTNTGLTVITGCSHPGLINILRKVSHFGEVYGVIGGFHGFHRLEALRGIKLIVPCHCTIYKEEILKLYPKSSLRCSAGCTIEI
jgi:7,8-dihydropterin-6-yl-methyl-4-(beta-D-ribofuranosyl)aminobenzene 5'-phosphate synthase